MTVNIFANTAKGFLFVREEMKLLGEVIRENKVKSAAMFLAPFPLAIIAGTFIIREYKILRRRRKDCSNPEEKKFKKMEPV